MLYEIPNVPAPMVPVGKDDSDNEELRRFGQPRSFSFEPKPHWELGKALDILDPEIAGKVSGARFHFYRGLGARLERAIINFFLNTHTENGYTEVFPPFMVNRASMTGTGQLPKFEEDAFKVANTDYFLIPTAEVPVTNLHRDEIVDEAELPNGKLAGREVVYHPGGVCVLALGEDGKLHLELANLVAYAHGGYFELGRQVGSFGYSVAKKKKTEVTLRLSTPEGEELLKLWEKRNTLVLIADISTPRIFPHLQSTSGASG